ncbi:hypothetical protein ACUOA5_35660, partial [Escherichia coli]
AMSATWQRSVDREATVRAKTEARFEVAADLNTQRGDL